MAVDCASACSMPDRNPSTTPTGSGSALSELSRSTSLSFTGPATTMPLTLTESGPATACPVTWSPAPSIDTFTLLTLATPPVFVAPAATAWVRSASVMTMPTGWLLFPCENARTASTRCSSLSPVNTRPATSAPQIVVTSCGSSNAETAICPPTVSVKPLFTRSPRLNDRVNTRVPERVVPMKPSTVNVAFCSAEAAVSRRPQ